MQRSGLLIIISSPSGAGKSTLARRLMEWDPTLRFSVSATTRPPRPGEVEGQHYYFMDKPAFDEMVAQDEMLEHAEVFGNCYGTPRAPVELAMAEGRDTIFDVDWQGGQQIRASSLGSQVVSIFILPPSLPELERRLRGRNQDSDDVIARRMLKSRDEISHWAEYDYVLVNDDIEAAESNLRAILTAERLRRERRPALGGFVRKLMEEAA
ncbi:MULTISPECIES: guanylate kinase [unclassified Paracoccus (in: a-proteobacteria)]|uniref:guanylate kinase n=1 Tax=unclassified Paracoccus (in: a-proteobacteria) TaxID=2688777 RepID=UPI0015FECAEC|nr:MULTISPECIES: guanylate kinase [unclassified Paracoccus (in: a-proteobacteria)]MBB1490909.1 guanylate kinase [Paracoccus sp. MC1854]MBB1497747.1 guanylate kinase [Paracoccus sp. MC1862]QQO46274.1 guanylate kinase [Paracoccus sp. MC1862]